MSESKLIREREVLQRVGLSPSTIRRLEKAGQFPRRRECGANSVAWVNEEISEWIASRPARVPKANDTEEATHDGGVL